jgi:hypothetical protein
MLKMRKSAIHARTTEDLWDHRLADLRLLGSYVVQAGNWIPTLSDGLLVPNSTIKWSKNWSQPLLKDTQCANCLPIGEMEWQTPIWWINVHWNKTNWFLTFPFWIVVLWTQDFSLRFSNKLGGKSDICSR